MKSSRHVGTRVNLTLSAELVAVLDRIAKASGTGRATMIREVLEDGIEGLRGMADALELAKKSNVDAFKALAKGIDQAAAEAQQLSLSIKSQRRGMLRQRKKELMRD